MEKSPEIRIAVDAVVFSVIGNALKILLIKRKNPPFGGKYALPGGFVEIDEDLEAAAQRELEEETGVKDIFLQQIGAYGTVGRDPRGRIVSVAFMALISPDAKLQASTDALKAEWFHIEELPELGFDHECIISDALKHLRYEIQTTNIALQILPKRFSLTALQQLYESVLGKHLDKRNFRKRIKELDILRETNEFMMEGAHRPARLYSFKNQRYQSIKEKVQVFL